MAKIYHNPSAPVMALTIDANAISFHTRFSSLPQAELHDSPEITWFITGLCDEVFNGVLRADLAPARVDPVISATLSHFRRRRVPMLWHVGPYSQPADLGQRLLAHGLWHVEDAPGMAADLHAIDDNVAPMPPGLTIELVDDDATLQEWVHVWAGQAPAQIVQMSFQGYRGLGFGADLPLRYYLGRLNDEPVATASLYTGAGVGSIEHVTTTPHARHRGIAAAMIQALLLQARAEHYRVAVVSAPPLGATLFRRLGFRDYCVTSKYLYDGRAG